MARRSISAQVTRRSPWTWAGRGAPCRRRFPRRRRSSNRSRRQPTLLRCGPRPARRRPSGPRRVPGRGWPRTPIPRRGSWPKPVMSHRTGRARGASAPTPWRSSSSTTSCAAPGCAGRPTRSASAGPGPTLIHAGTEAQKERYLLPLLAAEEIWCQLFSEPGAGSDLAGLSTRAVRDGDEWVVSGPEGVDELRPHGRLSGSCWPAPTPTCPSTRGISYFICPMDAPGVTIRPIVDMSGDHTFNEVFLDEVRLPAENLVGEVNGGWALAKVTLGNERVSLSGEGALWGQGPTVGRPGRHRAPGRRHDRPGPAPAAGAGVGRGRGAAAHPAADGRARRCRAGRRAPRPRCARPSPTTTASGSWRWPRPWPGTYGSWPTPGPPRALPARHVGARRAGGATGRRSPWPSMVWAKGYLFARALTIGGGTSEVQRNIIAERVLGLPHDVDVRRPVVGAVAPPPTCPRCGRLQVPVAEPRLCPGPPGADPWPDRRRGGRRRRRRRDG